METTKSNKQPVSGWLVFIGLVNAILLIVIMSSISNIDNRLTTLENKVITCSGTVSQDLSGDATTFGNSLDISLKGNNPVSLSCK